MYLLLFAPIINSTNTLYLVFILKSNIVVIIAMPNKIKLISFVMVLLFTKPIMPYIKPMKILNEENSIK